MFTGAKKSLYVFLTSMLGMLLFLILHRIAVFLYLIVISSDYSQAGSGLSYIEFLALDYFTLIITLLLGAWYGVWLGIYWFDKVYEEGSHGGLVNHITQNYWPRSRYSYALEPKIAQVRHKLEEDLLELQGLAKSIPASAVSPEPIKKQIIRKKAPLKLKTIK